MSEVNSEQKLGISGAIAKKFLNTEITPLLALVGLLLGFFAVLVTPREEEPQINVTFANIFIAYPGASAKEVESVVTTPAEQILSEIEGVKHVYSASYPEKAVLTVEFHVGEDRTQAIVRLYNAVYSKQDWLPKNLGVLQPIIKPKGIDDVPIVSLTLWSEDEQYGAHELLRVAHAVEAELKRVEGTRDVYTIGGPDRVVHVLLDADKLSGFNISIQDLTQALQVSNTSARAGELMSNNQVLEVQAGTFLSTPQEVANLVVGLSGDKPIYLRDIAEVRYGPDQAQQYVSFGTGPSAADKGIEKQGQYPAVTIAVAKKPGTNAVAIAKQVIDRFEHLKGTFVPDEVNVTVTRDYGKTANDKAMKLIGKLVFATAFVVLLVFFALGMREAFIVGVAVVITLALTLFASWAWGFTLNRVSLFALIFSIGILVDDAIVVVENIHRHMSMGSKKLLEAIPLAVDEVGGPTILATFTVIAALLPMAFVSGLMGPYMSPIPINASIGMLISLAVAFVITPWLSYQVFKNHQVSSGHGGAESANKKTSDFFKRFVGPFLAGKQGQGKRRLLGVAVLVLIIGSVSLVAVKVVVMKMLPYDNKSEIQVVLDMPEGTTLEQTDRILNEMAGYIATIPEVTDYQIYTGTAAPINFNGLVRQYYLREGNNVGDIQVNLVDKKLRERQSHAIALDMRPTLQKIADKYGVYVKVVEVPPGPPVQAPLVAEVYGLNYEGQIDVAGQIYKTFEKTNAIVDIDDSVINPAPKYVVKIDQAKAAVLKVSQLSSVRAMEAALKGADVSYLHDKNAKHPIPIRLEFAVKDKDALEKLLALRVRSETGSLIPLADIAMVQKVTRESPIFHKDLLPIAYVTADVAGELDSPLYGMFDIYGELSRTTLDDGSKLKQYLIQPPSNPYEYSIKWDGEWQITYETFRDMGIAYSVGLILIYLLVVAQFRSYFVPLVIMAPIPLTVIGVMPGHALLGEQFTATSMIGMIALAGIIVRNSILLVDFINQSVEEGMAFDEAVINAGAVRAKPIILTGLAAMLGALFILDDPIFSGLAISLIFGIFVSTLLTLVIIPVMYYAFNYKRYGDKAVSSR